MNIFKKFKVTLEFNAKYRKKKAKKDAAVICTKYRTTSEFTEEQVFSTSPRFFPKKFDTSGQSNIIEDPIDSSGSSNVHQPEPCDKDDNESYWEKLATNIPEVEQKENSKIIHNQLWPPEVEVNETEQPGSIPDSSNKDEEEPKPSNDEFIRDTLRNSIEMKEIKKKGILKKTDHDIDIEFNQVKQNSFESNSEEFTDNTQYEEVMYFDQPQSEDENYFVHRENHSINDTNDSEQEEDYHPPVNVSTHPKLNPRADMEAANTSKKQIRTEDQTEYSSQARSIFFDDSEEDTNEDKPRTFILDDNVSEMSV